MSPHRRRARSVCAATLLTAFAALVAAGQQPASPPAVPGADELKTAVETLRDVYEKDYAAAGKDAKGKKALAQKLLDGAPKRKTPAMVFASCEEARQLAAAGGDVKLALAAVEALNQRFAGAGRPLLRDTLKTLAGAELAAGDAAALVRFAQGEAAAALDREDYAGAVELAGLAAAAVKKAEDPDLALDLRDYRARVETLRKAADAVQANPNDPDANGRLGTYWVFERGRWATGLRFLAKSSDKPLAEAAARDIARPATAKDRTAVAEAWQKLARDAPPDRKKLLAERAWEWYAAAVAVAAGDDDLKPAERAKEIEKAYPELFDRSLTAAGLPSVYAVAVTPDGKTLLSGGLEPTVRVWDVASGKVVKTFEGHTGWVECIVVTPDGSKAVTAGGDNAIRVWDLKEFKQAAVLEGHATAVRVLAVSADGKSLVSGAKDGTVRLWDLAGNKEVRKFGAESRAVESVAVTGDGGRVLAGGETGVVTVYDAKTGNAVSKFDRHDGAPVYALAVTRDGKTAVSGGRDRDLRVWDVATGKELRALAGHTERVYQVALGPDDTRAVSTSFDRTVRVWDLATGQELKRFDGHTDGVQGVCLGPGGRTVFSAGWDKTVRKWRVPAAVASPAKTVE